MTAVRLSRLFAMAALIFFVCGCIAGGGVGRDDAVKRIMESGLTDDISVAENIANASYVPCRKIVEMYVRENDSDIRHYLLQNPSIGDCLQYYILLTEPDDYVRSGLASNPHVSDGVYNEMLKTGQTSFLNRLARNPGLDTEKLLDLWSNGAVDDIYFAGNPKCPRVILNSILRNGDRFAVEVLRAVHGEHVVP